MDDDETLDLPWNEDAPEEPPKAVSPPPVPAATPIAQDDDDIDPFTGLKVPKEHREEAKEIIYPWMRFHEFVLVKTSQEVEEIVDQAIANGSCSLDLETQGFDNRIDYDSRGQPHTRHQIVGVCIAIKGKGYYIPVRHKFDPTWDEPDPNVPPAQVEAALRRLCQAAQPVLTPEGLADDPLGSMKLAQPGKVVIKFWNAKFDQEFLFPVTGVDYWHPTSFEDGMLIRYCMYTDDTLKLKDHAKTNLRIKDPKSGEEYPYEMIRFNDLFKKEVKKADRRIYNLHPLLDKNVTRYGCSDAICTELLVDKSLPELAKLKVEFVYLVEKHVVQVVRQMERTRTKIDREEVARVLEEAKKELAHLDTQIKELAKVNGLKDFNPGSPQQLSDLLFGERYLDIKPKPPKTEGAQEQYKTDAETLQTLIDDVPDAPPVLQWVLHFRQVQKIIGTYLQRFLSDCDEQDQLRFNFNQTGAATGRFTAPAGESSDGFFGGPIQGIPSRDDPKKPKVAGSLRRVFVARPGYALVKADYAGQELRLVANVSGEPLWINEFLHGDGDLHSLTARAFFGIPDGQPVPKHQRSAGKTANFALVYGGGVQAVRRATGVDKHEAARQKAAFDKSVPRFTSWLKTQHETVKKSLGIRTAFGRWIAIPDANIKPGGTWMTSNGKEMPVDVPLARKVQAACERKSVNYPIQGAGADVMKISLVRLAKELVKRGWYKLGGGDDSVRMLMTIHDEIVFEIRLERLEEALPVILQIMESPTKKLPWKIPLIVEPDIGLNWVAKHHWLKIKEGKEAPPDWLAPYVKVEPHANAPKPEPAETPQEASTTPPMNAAPLPVIAPLVQPSPVTPPPEPRPTPVPKAANEKSDGVAVFSINTIFLTPLALRILKAICILAESEEGKRLRLTDEMGNVLIDSALGIKVDPVIFRHELRSRNLGHGDYEILKA